MTILVFAHQGRRVTTASWSAVERHDGAVEISYLRAGQAGDGCYVPSMPYAEFMARIGNGGIIDLDAGGAPWKTPGRRRSLDAAE